MNDKPTIAPPQGNVTLLFTDIEGSTARWEKHGPRFGEALNDHNRIMREAIARNNGFEVKTIGDAFMVAFADTLDAVRCAAEVQAALKQGNEMEAAWQAVEGLRVRIGIHCGEPEFRNNDYFGPVVNRAARVSDAGQGGMTVLSMAAYQAVCDRLPAPLELEDCGQRKLKDLTDPQPLYVLWLGTETKRPPIVLRTLDAPNNIPGQLNAFVGRSKERRELAKILRDGQERLITLTGPGGTGKTRLSMQVAVDQSHLFPGGLWFVELASVRDPDEVPVAIALALKLDLSPNVEPRRQVADYLRERKKRCLLVLDNFEQVVDAALIINDLLRDCPQLTCLVSSRELLMLSAEREYPLEPLAIPPASSSADWSSFESVQLFVTRCQTARPDFALGAENAPIVGEICRRLEGLPLSIELAAARVRQMTVADILEKLTHRLDVLQSQFRDLTPRQRTLRGAIDWSHDLLSEPERAIFSELAVFEGGFFLEAADAVCLTPGAADFVPDLQSNALLHADVIHSLREKSLLRADAWGGATRYSMLETIREYAQEKLQQSGSLNALRDSHARYYLDLAEPVSRQLLGGAEARDAKDRLTLELDNIRVGMDWSAAQRRDAEIVAYGNALTRFLIKRGLYPECQQRLTIAEAAAQRSGDTKTLAILLNRHGLVARDISRFEAARDYFNRCYAVSKAAGDSLLALTALGNLGSLAWNHSDFDAAQRLWEEARLLAVETGNSRQEADLCGSLGSLMLDKGDYDAAERCFARSLEIRRQQNNQEGLAYTLHNVTFLLSRQERPAEALAQARQAYEIFREIEVKNGIVLVAAQISHLLRESGQDAEAKDFAQKSLAMAREIGFTGGEMYALDALGCLAGKAGEAEEARRLFLQSCQMAREIQDRKQITEVLRHYGEWQAEAEQWKASYLALAIAARLNAELKMAELKTVAALRERLRWVLDAAARNELDAQAQAESLETIERILKIN